MKREVRFRGKSKETKEWVYGFYWASLEPCEEETKWRGHYIHNGCNIKNPTKVHPETVGQYTGRNTDDGVEIYEGEFISGIVAHPEEGTVPFHGIVTMVLPNAYWGIRRKSDMMCYPLWSIKDAKIINE